MRFQFGLWTLFALVFGVSGCAWILHMNFPYDLSWLDVGICLAICLTGLIYGGRARAIFELEAAGCCPKHLADQGRTCQRVLYMAGAWAAGAVVGMIITFFLEIAGISLR